MVNTYDYSVAHPDYFTQLAVKDLLFLHYICPQVDQYVDLFTHYNQISYTLGGKKIFHHGGKSWEMTENTSLFARKTAYTSEAVKSVGWEILAFYFPDSFLQQFLKEYRQQLPLNRLNNDQPVDMFIKINVNETTRAFFYSIIPYFSQQPPPSDNLLELKFKELLFHILCNPGNARLLAFVNNMGDQYKPPLHETMEANFMFNLSVTAFARMTQRSLATFKRDFDEYYHTSPGKWLTQKRLNYAKYMLDATKQNVNEICDESGFESVSHFSRVFKEKFGISPMQYRKQHHLAIKSLSQSV